MYDSGMFGNEKYYRNMKVPRDFEAERYTEMSDVNKQL